MSNIQELLQDYKTWKKALEDNGSISEGGDRLTVQEAFSSPDAPLIFPRVISDVLKEAAEPELNLTPLLAVVRIQGRSVEFPAVNAIQAFEIPEGQEYPEDALAFARQVEGKVSKKGLKVSITEEAIADSQWDLIGLHLRAAGRALARLKEGITARRLKEAATVVFDNDSATAPDTTGLGSAGTANQTLALDDVITMGARLLTENHVPTDVIMHPFMWAVWAYTPEIRSQLVPNGTMSLNAINSTAPFGLNVIVTPFIGFTKAAGSTPAKSDFYLIDRNEMGVNLVRDDLSTEEFNDPRRDIRSLKLRERYDIVMLGSGEGIMVAKGVKLQRSYEVQLTKTVA